MKTMTINADEADQLVLFTSPQALSKIFSQRKLFRIRAILKSEGGSDYHSKYILKKVTTALRLQLANG